MKYSHDTYLEYKVFCKSVVLEAKTLLDTSAGAARVTRVLVLIASILGQSLLVFAAIAGLASLGALAYFGSMGALIATNPWLAGILIAIGGLGLGGSIYALYQEREALEIVKEVVVDRYQGDYALLLRNIDISNPDLTEDHVKAVNALLKRSTADLINALHKIGKIDNRIFANLVSKI